jgi:hypothetical protein
VQRGRKDSAERFFQGGALLGIAVKKTKLVDAATLLEGFDRVADEGNTVERGEYLICHGAAHTLAAAGGEEKGTVERFGHH